MLKQHNLTKMKVLSQKRIEIIFILLLVQVIPIFGQQELLIINDKISIYEGGKCFLAYPRDSLKPTITYFEIEEEQYETIQIGTKAYLLSLGKDIENDSIWKIEVSPTTNRLVKRDREKPCVKKEIYDFDYRNSFVICIIEVPSRYITAKKRITKNNEIEIFPKIVNVRKVIEPSKVNILSESKIVTINDRSNIFSFEGSSWTNWLEMASCRWCYTTKIEKIQKSLMLKGYEIEVNGILNSETRKYLIDFQKKNGLPEGRLDIETLKKLGVL